MVSGSFAGSHWLSCRARERPLGAGSVRRGSRQRSAAPAARVAPQESEASAGAVREHRAGSRGTTGASAEDSSAGGVRENGSGRGRGALRGPPSTLPSPPPWNSRGVGLWDWDDGCGMGRGFVTASGPPAPECCCQHPGCGAPPAPPQPLQRCSQCPQSVCIPPEPGLRWAVVLGAAGRL